MYTSSIKALAQQLDEKSISCVELTQYYLDRIQRLNPLLNAYITVTAEVALSMAKKADDLRASGQAHRLAGIPIAHKDNICTQGIKTSCASRMLDNFIAPYDATLVHRFKEACLPLLGKTNMDEFAMGSTNESSYYGPVKNPWDLSKVPGGSSGGSAAAVAAGLVPAAMGTDTGGSVRQPASFCGLTGLRPTYGRISRYGMIAYGSSLDQAGILARTAEDIALLLPIIAGVDERDPTSVDTPVSDYESSLSRPLAGLRIGLAKQYFNDHLCPEVGALLENVKQIYERLGAQFIDIDLNSIHLAIPCYYTIAPAEASSNLARFDGIRFGHRCEDPANLLDLYERSRAEGFGDEVKRRIIIGTYVLSAGYYDAYYVKAQQIRRLIANNFKTAVDSVDVILAPTTSGPAFDCNTKEKSLVKLYQSDEYTTPVNLAGLPAISAPAGFMGHLPVGFQLIGNHFQEATLLNAVHQLQQCTDWHQQTPPEVLS